MEQDRRSTQKINVETIRSAYVSHADVDRRAS
jgi:hypothetical protein